MRRGNMQIQHYVCEIRDRRVVPVQLNGQSVKTFRKPATQNGKEKLYVVKEGNAFCYVGKTSTAMAQRLRTGFNPDTSTGYHGYQWGHLAKIDLFVWATELAAKATEAIEAELVFLIRSKTDNWPTHQTEIHFHNPVHGERPTCREIAQQVFDRLK